MPLDPNSDWYFFEHIQVDRSCRHVDIKRILPNDELFEMIKKKYGTAEEVLAVQSGTGADFFYACLQRPKTRMPLARMLLEYVGKDLLQKQRYVDGKNLLLKLVYEAYTRTPELYEFVKTECGFVRAEADALPGFRFRDIYGRNLLHSAFHDAPDVKGSELSAQTELLQTILADAPKELFEEKTRSGETPLLHAAANLHFGCRSAAAPAFKLLLDASLKVAGKSILEERVSDRVILNRAGGDGMTPLLAMCNAGRQTAESVQLLVDAGCDVHAVDDDNSNALFLSVADSMRSEHVVGVVDLLLKLGVNPRVVSKYDGGGMHAVLASCRLAIAPVAHLLIASCPEAAADTCGGGGGGGDAAAEHPRTTFHLGVETFVQLAHAESESYMSGYTSAGKKRTAADMEAERAGSQPNPAEIVRALRQHLPPATALNLVNTVAVCRVRDIPHPKTPKRFTDARLPFTPLSLYARRLVAVVKPESDDARDVAARITESGGAKSPSIWGLRRCRVQHRLMLRELLCAGARVSPGASASESATSSTEEVVSAATLLEAVMAYERWSAGVENTPEALRECDEFIAFAKALIDEASSASASPESVARLCAAHDESLRKKAEEEAAERKRQAAEKAARAKAEAEAHAIAFRNRAVVVLACAAGFAWWKWFT